MNLPWGSRSPLIAEPGDQKDTFNRGRQVSDKGMQWDLGPFHNSKGFCIVRCELRHHHDPIKLALRSLKLNKFDNLTMVVWFLSADEMAMVAPLVEDQRCCSFSEIEGLIWRLNEKIMTFSFVFLAEIFHAVVYLVSVCNFECLRAPVLCKRLCVRACRGWIWPSHKARGIGRPGPS